MAVTTDNTNKPILPRGADVRPIDSYNRAALYSGKALDFDGVNDDITISNSDSINITGDALTIAGYINTDGSSAWQGICYKDFGNTKGFQLFVDKTGDPNIAFGVHTGGFHRLFSNEVIENDKWYFVVATYDGVNQSIYINGAFDNSQAATGNITDSSTENLYIGRNTGGSERFNGEIGGFKIFNTALTAAQVADLYNNPEKVVPTGLESNLKLWLPMMEGAGTTAINGAPDALQDEEVTNGDFATDSDWTKGTGWSISGGLASSDGSQGATSGLTSATISGLNNKGSLLLEVVVDSVTAGTLYATLQGTGGLDILNISSAGTYKVLCETGDANAQITLGASADFVGSVSSVSLKELANCGSISGATWTQGIGAAVAQTAVINWNKGNYLNVGGTITEILVPQGLTSGRDLLGNLFENVRKQGALNLDGNSWAGVHDNESHDLSTAVTLEFWCKVPQIETFYTPQLIGKRDQYDSNWLRMYKRANGDMVLEGIGGANLTTSTPDNTWTHFVATLDGASAIIYKNGTSAATGSLSWTMVDRAPIGIGGWLYALDSVANANSLVNGQIAQPRIYNRALTASEVKNNYEVTEKVLFDGTRLLDEYSGAAAAYSLRLLDSEYIGAAVKVRRASDNAEQDIYFTGGELDTASLETFAGSGDAFVTTWYDQSGSGNDATQTTAASQPQIVSSGTAYTLNSKPAISGNGLKQLDISTELNIPNDFFIATTLQYDAHTMILGSNTDTINFLFSASLTQYRARIAGLTGYFRQNALALNTQYNSNVFKVGNNIDHSRNGELNGVQTGFTGRTFKINTIMNGYISTNYALSGYAQEIIIWESDQSSNRTGIETNINDFYDIY